MRRLTAAAVAASLWAVPVTAQEVGPVSGDGAALYLDGEGIEATLLDGKLRVPGRRFACGGCHGADAEGGREGGEVFPAIGWNRLTDARRPDGAYDMALFARALRQGIAPDGRTLSQAMPRYAADDAQVGALIGYLREVGDNQRQGVKPDLVRVGITGIPATEEAGLVLAVRRFNAAGGAFGRGLQLVRGGSGTTILDADRLEALLAPRIAAAEDRLIASADPGAAPILRLGQPAPRARPAEMRVISLSPDHAAAAIEAGLPSISLPAYLRGLVLGEALLSCGRDLRRACIEGYLSGIDPSGFLHLYRAGRGG